MPVTIYDYLLTEKMPIKTLRTLLPFIPLFIPLAMPVASLANEKSTQDEVETITIVSSRSNTQLQQSAQVVSVFTREDIEQLAITNDSSKILSSLLPAFAPSAQKLSGRGETFRGRTPLIMIDGVPQSNPLRPTGRSAHTIDLTMVERIEVIHGANAIHGIGSTGGIINYITRRAEKESFKQTAGVQLTAPTAELDSQTATHKFNYRLSGNHNDLDYVVGLTHESQGMYLDADDNAVGVDNTQGDLMDSKIYDLFANLGYWFDDDQKIELQLNRYVLEGNNNYVSVAGDRENGIATTSKREKPVGMAPSNKVTTVNVSYKNEDFNGLQLAFQLYHQDFAGLFGATDSSTFQDESIAPLGSLFDQSEAKSKKLGAKFTVIKDDLLDDTVKITAGFDVQKDTTEQSLALTQRSWVPESDFINTAPFIQLQAALSDNLILHSGIRHESAELKVDTFQTVASKNSVIVDGGKPDFNESLVNFGAVYHPTENIRLFANYTEGFEMADIGRVLRGIKAPDLDVDTFLDLSPIVTDNQEIGFSFDGKAVELELSYYHSSSDFGARLKADGDQFILQRQKTETSGVEASISYKVNRQHKLKLGYSYIKGEFDSDGDGSVDAKLDGRNVSPDRLIATWSGVWQERINTLLQINHAFSRSFDDADKAFSGYTLVDASIRYQLPDEYGTASLSLSNLLNKDYFTYFSQSGEVNDDRYFKGRGRTVSMGYSVDF